VVTQVGPGGVDDESAQSIDGVYGELLSKIVGALRLSSLASSMRRHISVDMAGISPKSNQRNSSIGIVPFLTETVTCL
jgi:hypothetical protein